MIPGIELNNTKFSCGMITSQYKRVGNQTGLNGFTGCAVIPYVVIFFLPGLAFLYFY